ncbi:MAG: DUF5686 family protein [Ginsengibacter sp.]
MHRLFGVFFMLLLPFSNQLFAQTTTVSGIVADSATLDPIAYASISFKGTNRGTTTDRNGRFTITIDGKVSTIEVSFVGYKVFSQKITEGKPNNLQIALQSDSKTLQDVTVKVGKVKYRNKDNPAVELIRMVIKHRDENRISSYDYLSYVEYEKLRFSLSNTPENIRKNFLVRKYPFMAGIIDTTLLDGKAVLPLYIEENISKNYFRSNPSKSKQIFIAEKKVTFDKDFINTQGVSDYMKHIFQPVDIYENNITLATNQFLSPIANMSPAFYKFFIADTIIVQGVELVDLFFEPRNPADFLFVGNMYVSLDGHYAVQHINLSLNKNINLNWVRSMEVSQEFERNSVGKYNLTQSKTSMDFSSGKNSKRSIYGERSVSYKDYKNNEKIPDSVFEGSAVVYQKGAEKRTDSFWVANRPETITHSEEAVYNNLDSLQRNKSFKRIMNIATLMLSGYLKTGKYFEIGPSGTFYGFNPVEGLRLRFGGRTLYTFSKHFYFEGYGAYGFKDQKWKYFLGGTYSLSGKDRFAFPMKKITVSYQKDTKIPGQELEFIQEDNVLLSFKRGVNDKWLYNDTYSIDYTQEFPNNFSFMAGYKNWKQQGAGGLSFVKVGSVQPISLTTSALTLQLRWAPHEKFYQGKQFRIPISNRYPVFTFTGAAGMKGLIGGQYNYQRISLNIYKRFYLSQLGYTDVVIDGGYIFGQVPYPLLDIHRANQTFAYQLESYNLMNFLEFVSDHYASINLVHNFNGFIFNKIPLIKKLKLREYLTAKVLYGGLRPENSSGNNNSDFLPFPKDQAGNATTFSLEKEPYIEGSVGVGNILKFFRIDLVKRFTYTGNPNVSTLGIRGRFKFDF